MSYALIGPLAEMERVEAFGPTGLVLTTEMEFDRWEALGWHLGEVRDATAFALGDWLLYGERVFGESCYQGIEATGRSKQTLMNYRWVALAVSPSRRRGALSWSHHRAVAKPEPKNQRRWLERAERSGWSVEELNGKLRALPAGPLHVEKAEDDDAYLVKVEKAARAAWRSSSLNVTKTEYVTQVEPMKTLGRLLDGRDP